MLLKFRQPALAGNASSCPCKKCKHNINKHDVVNYADHDTEIGCSAKCMRGAKLFVPVNTVTMTKRGCVYRHP